MNNKYQEALDRLRVDCNGRYDENGNSIPALSQKDGNDSLDTLQELIDNYIELVNEKCKKCGDFNIITKIEPLTILCKEKGCKWYGK